LSQTSTCSVDSRERTLKFPARSRAHSPLVLVGPALLDWLATCGGSISARADKARSRGNDAHSRADDDS
ncbi:hypothetical protein TSAR_007516, partial [Trichomalopsis sarcophagae]